MDLRSHSPFWLLKSGLINYFPSLQKNQRCSVAVMGAGITGALVAWHLCKAGFDVCIVDKRHAGMGSTAASTALLQYEIDTPLHELQHKVGLQHAVRSYQLCAEAIIQLQQICKSFNEDNEFKKRPSLQYASFDSHVKPLSAEYKLRKKHGFNVQFWDPEIIEQKFGFSAPAAIFSGLGAEVNAYRLTHQLLKSCVQMGARLFDNTLIAHLEHTRGSVKLHAVNGHQITCKHLVIACGYESQTYITKKVETIHATYAMISEPMPDQESWYRKSLIWETANPYLYMRTTSDHRILVGGLDDDFYAPDKRDARIPLKTKKLLSLFENKFPEIPFRPDFQWAGAFASTKDGLPFIGSIKERPNTSFALGFGGNGITFSVIAAQLITDKLKGFENPDQNIFSFNR